MSQSGQSVPPQVLAVALNPALDHTLEVERLALGEVNRALRMRVEVGGKGCNVASCLADFGIGTALTGLLGGENTAPFEALFQAKGIADHCLRLDGPTRVNTKLVERATGQTTDLNLPGPTLTPGQRQALLEALLRRLDGLLEQVQWVVLAGSLPPDWPDSTYRVLAERVRRAGRKVLLDASGPALAAGRGAAHILKPNRAELAELCGAPLDDLVAVVGAARSLLGGPETIVVSLGGQGAVFLDRDRAFLAHPAQVDLISTVGAGDAMVAGIIAAQLDGLALPECARLATAFAAAKLARLGPHLPAPDVVRALADTVQLSPIA